MNESTGTDDNRTMPGVPDAATAGTDPGTATEQTEDEKPASGRDNTTATAASGRAMPGVPETDEPKATESAQSGDSCGGPAHAETGTVHDLTTVFTFEALTMMADPAAVIADAKTWSDWVGMIGNADVPQMNTFLRRNEINVDFFNGASRPAARLRRVVETDSSFGSKRQVVVGAEDQAHFGAVDGWEFQDLESTAQNADWTLR